MLRILFINTPHYDMDGFWGAPTSIHYAATLITNNKDFTSRNELVFFEPSSLDEYFKVLAEYSVLHRYDVFAFSSTSHSHWIALKGAKIIKDCFKEAIIIFGGPHEDELDKRILSELTINKWNDRVDIVVSGDGEYALSWIILRLEENKDFEYLHTKNY